MKNVLFALQVFTLMALFPLYLTAELSHGGIRRTPKTVKPVTEATTPVDSSAWTYPLSFSDSISTGHLVVKPFKS